MATLRDIQRRIRSVQSTQKITKAMKLVAASKFRRAQERILAARPYATKMREEADKLLEEYRARLKEAREQAEDILLRSRKAADSRLNCRRWCNSGSSGQAVR